MSNQKLTRDQQREAARLKAKEMREAQKKADVAKRNWIIISSVAASLVLIGAIVWGGIQFATQTADNSKGPSTAFTNRGVTIGQNLVVATDKSQIKTSVPTIIIYEDLQCPACQAFEQPNMPQISELVKAGKYNLEIHPISFLDYASQNEYSSRAGSALMCVADTDASHFFDFNSALYANQPEENSAGPTSADLASLAASLGVSQTTQDCITANKWANWVKDSYKAISTGIVPGTGLEFTGTPFIVVNGKKYEGQTNNPAMFIQWLQSVAPVN